MTLSSTLLLGDQLSTTEKIVMTVAEIVKVLVDSHSEGKEVNLNKYVLFNFVLLYFLESSMEK